MTTNREPSTVGCRYCAVGLAVAGAVLWLVSACFIVADLSIHDRVPDTLPVGLGLLGSLTIGAALALWNRSAMIERLDRVIQLLDGEQGQRPDGELPPGTPSRILKLGIRMGEKRAMAEFPHLAPISDQPRPADRG